MANSAYRPDIFPNAPSLDRPERTGDFDIGLPLCRIGAYLNKPDEGNLYRGSGSQIPYFENTEQFQVAGETFFSPNRIMPSAGMFGSLPTGVKRDKPWETLLFRPQGLDFPATGTTGLLRHPNFSSSIPDHLLLDLFWMPVVEPYAISEPFSTAGKINLNYQIAPFTYINRKTGLHALLANERVAAIPNSAAAQLGNSTSDIRYPVKIVETLAQMDQKFTANNIFRSASEICDIHIVPDDPASADDTVASIPAYWNAHRLTGDNLRERIYTTLYPRLTTKSNVFTVHYRVQALKQTRKGDAASDAWYGWDETKDKVVSEQRGSVTIERYIDPNESGIPDFATDATAKVDNYYRFRIIDHKRFAP